MALLKVATLLPEWEGNTSEKSGKKKKGVVTVTSHLFIKPVWA
jgi:hypothetical protein